MKRKSLLPLPDCEFLPVIFYSFCERKASGERWEKNSRIEKQTQYYVCFSVFELYTESCVRGIIIMKEPIYTGEKTDYTFHNG